ncbi:hypothetical protein JYT92_00175 [bacterium AH-315-L15]|nr:hypothetical protein [bacterium AH-315-L15]
MNKHGLNRRIPPDIKREVRQRCGFGCVICGLGIVQYEHVEPEFSEAQQHEADKIALLCPQCHAKVTTKFWSKEKIRQAMQNPICLQQGYTKEVFDFCDGYPILQFGGMSLSNCPIPIEVAGQPLFKIEKPEVEGAPFRLSGIFCDSKGKVTLQIIENEWIASSENWDVEVSGGAIVIREAHRKVHLKLKVEPPKKLIVDRLDMFVDSLGFEANGDFLRVKSPNGSVGEFTGCGADNCRVGMSF